LIEKARIKSLQQIWTLRERFVHIERKPDWDWTGARLQDWLVSGGGSAIPGAKTESAVASLLSMLGDFLPALKGSGVGSSAVVNRQSNLSGALVRFDWESKALRDLLIGLNNL
jgi:hypothetical protein